MELTKEQIEAINSQSNFLAITAGAGSGKTLVLAERIRQILETKKAGLDDILAVTFTEKAAQELKARIAKVVNDPIAISLSYIGTFHSFCARILREHSHKMGIDPDFDVIEEARSALLMQRAVKEALLGLLEQREPSSELAVNELDFKNTIRCIEELLRFRWHAQKLKPDSLDTREASLQKAMLYLFNASLERYNKLKGLNLDFQDLEISALKFLKSYPKRFKYILVDEFQDVNDAQAELIKLLHNKNSLTIVGDERQAIYGFRGASTEAFRSVLKTAETSISLDANFRSSPEIISFINATFADFPNLTPTRENTHLSCQKTIVSSDEGAGIHECRENEAKLIAKAISHLKGTTACLFSSLKSADIYARALAEQSIPYILFGGDSFLNRQEIIDAINLLKVANNPEDKIALLAIARSPYIGMTDEEIYLHKNIKEHKKAGILKLLEEDVLALTTSELIRKFCPPSPQMEKFINIAYSAEADEKMPLSEFIAYIDELRNNSARISDFPISSPEAVNLMTIHQAKGLEFDNVILADTIRFPKSDGRNWRFVRGSSCSFAFKFRPEDNPVAEALPSEKFAELDTAGKKADEEEKLRLLYVAATRAKDRLLIPLHPEIKKDGPWHKLLLKACENIASFVPGEQTPPNKVAKTEEPKSVTGRFATPDTFTMTELEIFSESPEKYHERFILNCPDRLLPEEGVLPANIKGDIVHRLIEQNKNFDDPERFLKKTAIEYEVHISNDEKKDILSRFRSFKESSYGGIASALHETPFMLKVGDIFIKGKIDMLITNSSNWEIVDFKTGRIKDYSFQAKVYSLAVARHLQRSEGFVTFLFLTPEKAEPHQIRISQKILQETENELIELAQKFKQCYNEWMGRNYSAKVFSLRS